MFSRSSSCIVKAVTGFFMFGTGVASLVDDPPAFFFKLVGFFEIFFSQQFSFFRIRHAVQGLQMPCILLLPEYELISSNPFLHVCSIAAALEPSSSISQAAHRWTSTGILQCVRTLTVSLPRTYKLRGRPHRSPGRRRADRYAAPVPMNSRPRGAAFADQEQTVGENIRVGRSPATRNLLFISLAIAWRLAGEYISE